MGRSDDHRTINPLSLEIAERGWRLAVDWAWFRGGGFVARIVNAGKFFELSLCLSVRRLSRRAFRPLNSRALPRNP